MACALLYNFKDAARLQKVRFALFKLGVSGRVVAPEKLSQPIGYLCDLEGFSPVEETVEGGFSDEMLVLCGLSGPQLDALLSSLRRSRVVVALKAVVTEDNAAWSSLQLHDELRQEHEARLCPLRTLALRAPRQSTHNASAVRLDRTLHTCRVCCGVQDELHPIQEQCRGLRFPSFS